jgi:aromatic-L-amino-acid/L-tryptophan decarboxylase
MLEDIKKELSALEKVSNQLELSDDEINLFFNEIQDYTSTFLSFTQNDNTYNNNYESAKAIEIPFEEQPSPLVPLLEKVKKHVDKPGINPASGGHLGYIPGGGILPSAFADFIAAMTNRYAGVYYANPGAVRMENDLIKWTANLFGYPENAAGNLTTGGSLANLIAIVSARDHFDIKAVDIPKHVIYLTDQVHHCIDKSIRIAGLKDCVIRYIKKDTFLRMDAGELDSTIAADKEKGLIPFIIIASAGTTDTGAVDPLDRIGDIANKNHIWFHVDAAYGGYFILTEQGRKVFRGIEKSDSLVVDPHKGLFLPYGLGIVIVKNQQDLYNAHYYNANYMQDVQSVETPLSPADLSPELTKHFRGLRMWLPLHYFGISAFRAALKEKLVLTHYFYHRLMSHPAFELGPFPDLSVLIFRIKDENPEVANQMNRTLIKLIHEDGRVFLSSTTIDEKVWIRLAVLAFRTHRSTIDKCLDMVYDQYEKVNKMF